MRTTILSFVLALFLVPGLAWAQEGTIQGTVVDADTNEPLPGVNVALAESQQGAATSVDGEYEISGVAPGSYTLRATFVGYETYEQQVDVGAGETATVNIDLQPSALELDEVAVTALGFRTERDQLGASQSNVSGDAITQSGETSVLKGLSAKAPGLNVTSTGGDPGSGARIVIRGSKTIQGDNQPLIVVDGVPVSNENIGQGVGGVQQQSRLNDINPEDIASVEILKGASAAALWGSRAQSGVIVIETKSGGYQSKTNVSFKSSLTADALNKTQDLQEAYGQGFFMQYAFGDAFSWGDRVATRAGGADEVLDGPNDPVAVGQQTGTRYYQVPNGTPANPHGGKNSKETFDHGSDLFETGTRFNNSLSVSGGGPDGRYYLSIGNTRQSGIIPENSNYDRTSIRLNAERQVSDKVSVSAVANYVRTNSDRVQQGSNISGLLLGSYRTAPDFNNADYTVNFYPNGLDGAAREDLHRSYRAPLGSSNGAGYDNPYFTMNKNTNTTLVNRFLGKVEGSYDPTNWLNLTTRVGLDTYTDRRQVFFPIFNSSAPDGSMSEQELSEYRINVDVLGRASRALTDNITGSATVGFNFSHREFDNLGGSLNDFSNPIEVRSLGNSVASNISAFTGQSVERTASVFSEVELGFYEQLFVTATGRFDQASTFGPEADNTFFYPSVQAAWQFTDLLPESDLLSFGKLRASFARVGREPGPYQAFTYFSSGSFFDGYTGTTLSASGYGGGFEQNNNLGNSIIQPEETTEYEAGLDLRFWNDRLSFNGTYYFNQSTDVIFPVDVAPSAGFTSRTDNVAEIENRGVELQLDADWVVGGDFRWSTNFRWWTNENEVVSLAGVEQVGLAGFVSTASSLVEGEEFGVLYGNRWRRADFAPLTDQEQSNGFSVADDGRILDPSGFPVQAATQGVIGNPNPDWQAGIGNTFQYKGVSLDVLFDVKVGGDVWNGTKGALYFFGRHGDQDWTTTVSADQAGSLTNYMGLTLEQMVAFGLYPESIVNDDGSYTFRGYVQDFGGGDVIVDGSYFWSGPGSGFTGPGEQFIEDGSYVRLREVTLSYNWNSGLVQRAGLSSVDVSFTGRNLWLSTDYSGIDPETNLTGPSNGQGLDYFNNPNTRSYQFTLRFNY